MNHKCDLLREKEPTVLKRQLKQLIARIQPLLTASKRLLFFSEEKNELKRVRMRRTGEKKVP